MFKYLSRCEYSNIRNRLFIIYALNVNDIQLTRVLLSTGMFREANPVMEVFLATPLLTILSKLVLPAVLFIYIGIRLKKASPAQLKKSNVLVNIIFIVYTLINILHLIWIILYFIVR